MLINRITDARIAGAPGPVDLDLADGGINAVSPAGTHPTGPGATVLPVDGRVVVPVFVDAHVHLDKAFLLGPAEAAAAIEPTLASALAAIGSLRTSLSSSDTAVDDGARLAVERLVAHGVTAARVHVELDPVVGLGLVDLHAALVDVAGDRIELQGVAFPQAGLEPAGMVDLLDAALATGLSVVGGCPYLDADPGAHLDTVFALAERHQVPVDLHLDFGDDPSRSLIKLVAERTRAHGLRGRVAIGHATTLAAMDEWTRAATLDAMAVAGIGLIVLPATDLYLAGQGTTGQRAIAPIIEAHRAGVVVAVGNNNISNPFSPFGNASPLAAAWLAGLVGRTTTPDDRAVLLAAITDHPARLLGLAPRVIEAGAPADLVVLDTFDPAHAVSQAPAVLASVRAGASVHTIAAPLPVAFVRPEP